MTAGAPRVDVAELRRRAEARAATRPLVHFDGEVSDAWVAETRVRHYLPHAHKPTDGTVFFLHGGYGLFGDLDLQDGYCRRLATRLQHHVISIDYPLAPEHSFATAVASTLDVVREQRGAGGVIISGDSAGGAVAVAAAHDLRRGHKGCDGLLLTNPNLDLTLSSVDRLAPDGPDLGLMHHAMDHWSPIPSSWLRLDRRAAGLPPTMIAVGANDSLGPESRHLHDACQQAGVHSRLLVCDGMGHGLVSDAKTAVRVVDEAAAFFA